MSPNLPKELEGIYDSTEYARQQAYQKENSRFAMISDGFSFIIVAAIIWYGGAGWLDGMLRMYIDNAILLSVMFFWVFSIFDWILNIPFDWYDTFVIEQKFGFNKTTRRTFALDEVKSIALKLIIEGVIISILVIAFNYIKGYSWIWAWAAISVFTLTLSFFYSEWIVPIFNKQTPLEEGELRSAIEIFAQKTSFSIRNIYVIDGSKRSTKSNAYFTGFGKKKRIVLYDTLINDLNTDEIVAVLAHEIGHYKKKHVIYQIAISISFMGLLLWALTLFLDNPEIAYALGGTTPSFHLAAVGFSLIYSPFSEVFNFAANYISRKNEYAADNFAASHGMGEALIEGLKKISSKALSNLTPHHFVVFWRHSHPTLLQRMRILHTEKTN
ncbi:MAG: M48 family metallopeptidase [Synergistaceae bacterium]|nr:M48 family metallopeptidase [Synergistaceae bacterium]